MRRQRFWWTYLAIAIILTVYGGFNLVYHLSNSGKLSILSLVFLIIGTIMLLFYLVLFLITIYQKKKHPVQVEQKEEVKEETPVQEIKKDPYAKDPRLRYEYVEKPKTRNRHDEDDFSYSIYVKKVGYGPVLEINGNRIRDMRFNRYYRIENNYVYSEGSGVIYEIYNGRIKSVTGGQLYKISGNNINKVFGGFYASISGNYITLFDLSEKYETTGSLNQKQLLVVAVLLFGTY